MFRSGLQPAHVIVVILAIVLIFGSRRLPEVAGSIGKSLKVFKKELTELRDLDDDSSAPGETRSAKRDESTAESTAESAVRQRPEESEQSQIGRT